MLYVFYWQTGVLLILYKGEFEHNETFRVNLTIILLGRCMEMLQVIRLFDQFVVTVNSIVQALPGIISHLITVMFSVMHVFACIGLCVFKCKNGPCISPSTDFGHGSGQDPLYSLLNFDTYFSSMVTLFNMLIVNNWNVIAEGYSNTFGVGGFVFFASYYVAAVMFCLATVTAYFVFAFLTRHPQVAQELSAMNDGELATCQVLCHSCSISYAISCRCRYIFAQGI